MIITKITKIETPDTVYNLHIQDNHNYFTEGGLVSNCHTAKAASFETIIMPSTPNTIWKLGFTGTLPKELVEKMTILSSLGPEKKYITTKQLIDRGLATPALIKPIFLEYPEDERKKVLSMKYQEEVKHFSEHTKRNSILSKIINKASNSGNTIVLFDRKEHGKELCLNLFRLKYPNIEVTGTEDKLIKELMKADNPYNMYYIVGESKSMDREAIRKLLEIDNNKVVFGTSSILSTGINIRNLHHLFLVSGGKSATKLHQSIGRLLRTHASKNLVCIWDIVDVCNIKTKLSEKKNYLFKHFEERLQEYLEAEYPIEERSLQL
jgi:superfamily II DNA or RNA helicase